MRVNDGNENLAVRICEESALFIGDKEVIDGNEISYKLHRSFCVGYE